MIKVENIDKRFDNMEALKKVSITVNKGSIYGLLGSNGAGKTTLLKILAGIYKQDSGNVSIENQTVYDNEAIKSRLIFIPDTPYFFPGYTIKDMAVFYKRMYPSWNDERFEKLKQAFEIDIKKKIHKLSKGMQRQVAFWLALSAMPELLILDEPFDGLDAVMRQKIKNFIVQDVAEREMTVLISSHNLRELEDLCDYVGVLHKGSVVFQKDLDDLKIHMHKVQAGFKSNQLEVNLDDLEILHEEKRGGLRTFIIKGDKAFITNQLTKFEPAILDIQPLTLEEIFIYEMGDLGYEIKNIII